MLTRGDLAQNETLERLKHLLGGRQVRFTLVGSARCREYGLSRTANDLDFVVDPYKEAMVILKASGEFEPVVDDDPDSTGRTCTERDTRTGVRVDFLESGIGINDGSRWIMGVKYRDPLPIHTATGVGDVASLPTLITMKLNGVIIGEDILKLGSKPGRSREKIERDISDVRELIAVCALGLSLPLGHHRIQNYYEKLVDEKSPA